MYVGCTQLFLQYSTYININKWAKDEEDACKLWSIDGCALEIRRGCACTTILSLSLFQKNSQSNFPNQRLTCRYWQYPKFLFVPCPCWRPKKPWLIWKPFRVLWSFWIQCRYSSDDDVERHKVKDESQVVAQFTHVVCGGGADCYLRSVSEEAVE